MSLLITGFPGFIAARLVERLIVDRPDDACFYLLVEASQIFAAEQRCRLLEREHPRFCGRWRIVEGDITRPRLGICDRAWAQLRSTVSEVWHLAALYDLGVELAPAYRVNVDGTLQVLELCEQLPALARFAYVSTCYVSGTRGGRIYEDELDCGQGFKNHYESTKCWAEKHVRARRERIPTIIFRPAIVVGDSTTGEVAKLDGPYHVLRLLMRLPRWIPFVRLGEGGGRVNLVPVDYVVDAMARLSTDPAAIGRTFHLADPSPHTAAELTSMFCTALGRAPVVATVPERIAGSLREVPELCRWLGIPRQAFDYFEDSSQYDTKGAAELLAAARTPPPPLPSYLDTLVAYLRRNPQLLQTGGAR